MRRVLIISAVAAVGAGVPDPADAAGKRQPAVWATVNVCDTQTRPNQIGIRGEMAGLPRYSRMHMRFRVQFKDGEGRWRSVTSSRLTDSGWVRVFAGRGGEHDAGWSFEFKPPTSGGAHVMRGVVSFEWRRGRRVVERARAFTEAGHPGTAGAEPKDFSAAACEIA